MIELLFSEVNTALTILSIVFVAYWLITMLFGLDLELDFDVDADIDMDIDVDAHVEGVEIDVDTDAGVDDVANTEVDPRQIVGKRKKTIKMVASITYSLQFCWNTFNVHVNMLDTYIVGFNIFNYGVYRNT